MLVRKIFTAFFILLFLLGVTTNAFAQNTSRIYFFYGIGCPHCGEVERFFEEEDLYARYPVEKREIYFNRANALLFSSVMDRLGVPEKSRGVPAVVIGNKLIVGDEPIKDNFVAEADKFSRENINSDNQLDNSGTKEKEKNQSLDLTLAAVLGASTVDAINPCAFAVLIILMTTILATGDGRKALKTGLAFAASIFISYFLMGLGLYKALGVGEISHLFYKIVGWLAIILGLANLKDYFWYGKGFLMEVPTSWRPKLKSLLRSATSPLGAFGIGFLVSLILLPCTSGPYIVILGMLAKRATQLKAVSYLVLYNLIFISPMVVISYAIYKGFDPAKAEEIRQKRLRTLHLIAGLIMLAMGVVILAGWI
jgi:cytochrome c biogenesis protein CcdA/glutaredoxin